MDTKLKCLLLDDELPGLTYLKMLCEQIPELEIVKAYNSPKLLLQDLSTIEFDLLISDIEMPEIDGLELANVLKDKLVIFCTAYKDYAAAAFDLNAVDYITKPLKAERLQRAVMKAMALFQNKEIDFGHLQCNSSKGKTLVYYNQIIYIKTADSDSRDKNVLLKDGSYLHLKNVNFRNLLKVLPVTKFCRINKKEVIAIGAVKFFNHSEIVLSSKNHLGENYNLLLSETYRSDFIEKLKT